MLLLIDGYNLLHQSDLLGRGRAERWLQRARERLLRQLVNHLGPGLCAQTCVVFDVEDPPPGRPPRLRFAGIDVRFAVDHPEADDLLEELIAQHPAPARLTVVSSDHRIQRAIRRRRGHFFDADPWYQRLLTHGPPLGIPWPPVQADVLPAASEFDKPAEPLNAQEAAQWLEVFGLPPADETVSQAEPPAAIETPQSPLAADSTDASEPSSSPPVARKASRRGAKDASSKPAGKAKPAGRAKAKTGAKPKPKPKRSGHPRRKLDAPADNPFPEGYGEDLL